MKDTVIKLVQSLIVHAPLNWSYVFVFVCVGYILLTPVSWNPIRYWGRALQHLHLYLIRTYQWLCPSANLYNTLGNVTCLQAKHQADSDFPYIVSYYESLCYFSYKAGSLSSDASFPFCCVTSLHVNRHCFRYLSDGNTSKTNTMFVKHSTGDLLPDDWPFLPIMHLYQTSNSRYDTGAA